MMSRTIPRAPLLFASAALLPFLWGTLTVLLPDLGVWSAQMIGPRFTGPYVMLFYGAILLAFMSGSLWGFAARLRGAQAVAGHVLAALPALWAFAMTGGGPTSAGISLMTGFAGMLGVDWLFWRHGLAPGWWIGLRLPLIITSLICLGVGVFL